MLRFNMIKLVKNNKKNLLKKPVRALPCEDTIVSDPYLMHTDP